MSAKKRVFIAGDETYGYYHRMFLDKEWVITESITNADLVQFTGGIDVCPRLYGEKKIPETIYDVNRDFKDGLIFLLANESGIPMAGICRGAQFLHVMCGGSLWQHVDNHSPKDGRHMVYPTLWGETPFLASSTHHQMMKPTPDSVVLLTAKESTERVSITDDGVRYTLLPGNYGDMAYEEQDIEAIIHPSKNRDGPPVFCFQPHPEYPSAKNTPMREYYFRCITELLGVF